MRVMAIDYGDAHTGIAVSDPTGRMAGFATVIDSRKEDFVLAEIARYAKERQADTLVMGFPKNMDGTEGPRADLYRSFAAKVGETVGIFPVLWDERRTTIAAHDILTVTGNRGKQRKSKVDAVAATLILEGYLSFLRNSSVSPT